MQIGIIIIIVVAIIVSIMIGIVIITNCIYEYKTWSKKYQFELSDKHRIFNSIEMNEVGLQNMKTVSMLIVGLARDIDKLLERNLEELQKTGNVFKKFHIIIFENGSSDNTRQIIENHVKTYNNLTYLTIDEEYVSAISFGSHTLKRFELMALFRNKYVDEINTQKFDEFTHVAVVDFDSCLLPTTICLSHGFNTLDWDLMGANGIEYATLFSKNINTIRKLKFLRQYWCKIYDLLAFRDHKFQRVSGHCMNACEKTGANTYFDYGKNKLHPVTSTFSGMVIYKKDIFKVCRYDAYDCEHICLHDNMIKNGFTKMFIHSQMLLAH